VRGWQKASGGIGPDLEWRTQLAIIEPRSKQERQRRRREGGKQTQASDGELVGLLWKREREIESWHPGVPGHVDEVPATILAEQADDYKELEELGDTKVPTIFLNSDYGPLKRYEAARSKELTETGLDEARERYAVGAGLGLLLLDRDLRTRANGKPLPDEVELTAKQAAAQSALVMMPQYDRLA
jgi:hypothetical protein